MIIPLGDALPRRSSNLPASFGFAILPASRTNLDLSALAHRADTLMPDGECGHNSCLFGLAPCGVYHAASLTRCPVRSYRTFSPLPHLLRDAAVYFLLHWPSSRLEATVPDVIRHTALRSPDFPPPPGSELREAAIIRPPALSV
jgi:hypothetical protein